MNYWLFVPFVIVFLTACERTTYMTVGDEVMSVEAYENAAMAEQFIDLVLNNPEAATDLMHDDFRFRYMGKLPIYAQGDQVIKSSYNKDTYFSEFLEVVMKLVPDGIVLTPIDVIADTDSAAVVMVGDAEGKYGEYDNEYVFTYKFKDGKIIEVDEYNSDYLVAKSLYGNNLVPAKYSNQMLVEYIWHEKGSNYSQESFASLIDTWNGMIDEMSCEMNGANILTPREENENFDFLWMIAWPSEDARDDCWFEWLNGNELEWNEAIEGIIEVNIDNAFLFDTEIGRFPKSWSESDNFIHSYFFCNYKEGADKNTLYDYRADLNAINTLSENHWYVLLDPTFVPDQESDFVWLDIWPDESSRNSDLEIWGSSDLPKRAEESFACSNELQGIAFNGYNIRS